MSGVSNRKFLYFKLYINNLSNISNRFYVRASETDFNNMTRSGYFFGKFVQNSPDGTTDSNWIVEVQAFDNSTGWTFQRATRSSDKAIFTRIQDNGTWSDWEVIARKSDLSQNIIAKTFNAQVTVKANEGYVCDVPFTVPDGYELLDVVDTYILNTPASLSQQGIVEDKIRVYLQPFYDGTGGVCVKVLFKKKS